MSYCEQTCGSRKFSLKSVKTTAQSIGFDSLDDDVAELLAEEAAGKVKLLVQDAAKFMHHERRDRLLGSDIDKALRLKGMDPELGYENTPSAAMQYVTGRNSNFHFCKSYECDFDEINARPLPHPPLDLKLHMQWISLDAGQAAISEKPVTSSAVEKEKDNQQKPYRPIEPYKSKFSLNEQVLAKGLSQHGLSAEEQLFYKELLAACYSSDSAKRSAALQSLSDDPTVLAVMPYLSAFIAEEVKTHVGIPVLIYLISLMRMVRAIMSNSSVCLAPYLHEIMPAVLTCVVSRRMCSSRENCCVLRAFSSCIIADICETYATPSNDLLGRVMRIYVKGLQRVEADNFSSLCGCIFGLCQLGPHAVKTHIIPRLKFISERLQFFKQLDNAPTVIPKQNTSSIDVVEVLEKHCAPILMIMRKPPDIVEEYQRDFGYFGKYLYQRVSMQRFLSPKCGDSKGITALSEATKVSSRQAETLKSITNKQSFENIGASKSSTESLPVSARQPFEAAYHAVKSTHAKEVPFYETSAGCALLKENDESSKENQP